jgi:predicted transcriptional regulator of viral defense system
MSVPAPILGFMSSDTTPGIYRLTGIVTTAELRADGVSTRQLCAQVAAGELVQIGRGYYAKPELIEGLMRLEFGSHFLAAYMVIGALARGAVASHRTAAHIHGLDLLTEPGSTVTVTRSPDNPGRSAKSGVHLHVSRLPPGHVMQRFGLPITTVARTVLDLARSTPFREGVVVADSALHQHLTSRTELQAVLAESRRSRGSVRAAQVIDFADGLSESPLESIARVVFRDCGLPQPALQVRIGGDEFIGRVDFLWKRYRTIAEVDGALKYSDPSRARAQLRRDKRLREAGYEVVHFDWREITSDPDAVAASIRAAFQRGSQRSGSQRKVPGSVA